MTVVALLEYISANATLEGAILLWLTQIVGYLMMIPTSVLSVAAGCAYGLPLGLIVGLVGHLLGCLPPFLASRRLVRQRVAAFAAKRPLACSIMAAVDEQPKLIVILLRLSPAPLPLSYVLGITSIPATTYLFATAIGAFPQLFMSVYIGTFMSSMRAVLKGDTAMPWPMVCFGVTAGIAASVIISAAAKKKIEEATAAAQKEPPTPATIGKIKSETAAAGRRSSRARPIRQGLSPARRGASLSEER